MTDRHHAMLCNFLGIWTGVGLVLCALMGVAIGKML